MPIITAAFDYIENGYIAEMLSTGPQVSAEVVAWASFWTQAKSLAALVTETLCILLAAFAFTRWWHRRRCAASGLTRRQAPAIEGHIRREEMMPAYDPNNIFAKILRGELPCHKIYEDAKVLAFLDIMPRAPGHALVLPKAPARNILDIAPDDLADVMKAAQKIAKVSVGVFGADGVTVQQFNEPAGGQVVFHLHVHVIPRKDGIALKPPASVKEDPAVLKEQAAKLAAALAQA